MTGMHMGRSWHGHPLEDGCPCEKAPCGLVSHIVPECEEHWWERFHTMRQIHDSDHCPAVTS